ncbi:indole-3-glycerol phosphate synthase TrpC [Arthrobacter sp. UM1]|uniref:indole-3-glycerol phosphate synthase TrpC n=1 Tax=Arthrobacter sp. UM1 TaxID=2766776 RepID=UPI001CF69020|nr:indole-3-glycerol phosphate synthase TrpC [Arthrobacter sp. UM1]
MSVLDSIVDGVREDLARRRSSVSAAQLEQRIADQPPARDALAALRADGPDLMHVIAEVKRKSPSKGALADIPAPAELAAAYERGGANVVSVLTEERRFGGSLDDLDAVRAAVDLPVLRKDFMVDEYQFLEARAHGADLVLLIVAALDEVQLRDFHQLARSLGMRALVEAHTEAEVERAAELGAEIVGVNVRNLKTLEVDLSVYERLASGLPESVVKVAESGVSGLHDVEAFGAQGANAVLVGEALVKHAQPEETVREFRRVSVSHP